MPERKLETVRMWKPGVPQPYDAPRSAESFWKALGWRREDEPTTQERTSVRVPRTTSKTKDSETKGGEKGGDS